MTGTWMQAIAQGLVVLALWNSPFALASPTPNAYHASGDALRRRARRPRRPATILLVTQAWMAALALGVGVLVATHAARFWMLVVATAMLGVAFGYDQPAYQSFLPTRAAVEDQPGRRA